MSKVALIIGHSRKSQGATNRTYGTSEFQFNEPLAYSVAEKLIIEGHEPRIIYRDCTYAELPAMVNSTKADIAVSFHCNAFNSKSNGSETLYYKSSSRGHLLASCIQEEVVKCLELRDRGIKACVASHQGKAGDRGGLLLKRTAMPCVIVEPFFIDSDISLELANIKFEGLAEAYTAGIVKYLRR
tara:strand:+ start:140 stop:694 length:555 start_codon:yes stop_codon:yes gene_type:complete